MLVNLSLKVKNAIFTDYLIRMIEFDHVIVSSINNRQLYAMILLS